MEDKNDGEKNGVTRCCFIIAVISAIIISILLVCLYALSLCNNSTKNILEYIPTAVQTSFAAILGCLGVNILRTRNGKGTKYYPMKYGKRKLKKIIDSILTDEYKENGEKYNEVVSFIHNLKKEEYFSAVYHLQDFNFDFYKLWNDFNYYSNAEREKDKAYWFELKKCIYIKIYEYKNKQQ